jgi:hypothetical protein
MRVYGRKQGADDGGGLMRVKWEIRILEDLVGFPRFLDFLDFPDANSRLFREKERSWFPSRAG